MEGTYLESPRRTPLSIEHIAETKRKARIGHHTNKKYLW